MNMKQTKQTISKFLSADVSGIKDDALRAHAQKLQNKQKGFTLLELLVVVSILAILAGAAISALDGSEENAAQATTVHTMAALEDGFRIYNVREKRTFPAGLDSLICSDGVDVTVAAPGANTLAAANNALLGGTSNVARIGGGITADMATDLIIVEVDDGYMGRLVDNGLTSLRYVDAGFCDQTADNSAAGNDTELVEVSKPNLIFSNYNNDSSGDWNFGAGHEIDLTVPLTAAIPMVFHTDPVSLGGEVEDVLTVLSIGPDSDLVGEIVARAPSDGNVGPDKYGNYSLVIKIGECDATGESLATDGGTATCLPTAWEDDDEIELVAILDGGGDEYNDEIAEARGNEDE